jgi:hypothetical protein
MDHVTIDERRPHPVAAHAHDSEQGTRRAAANRSAQARRASEKSPPKHYWITPETSGGPKPSNLALERWVSVHV